MARFTDNQQRIWIVYVDVPIARKIRDLLDVNILNLQEALPQLAADPILLVDVLYVLCREQVNQRGSAMKSSASLWSVRRSKRPATRWWTR